MSYKINSVQNQGLGIRFNLLQEIQLCFLFERVSHLVLQQSIPSLQLVTTLHFKGLNIKLNMSANLENSAGATGLEKISFHSSPKERQCQRMLKLPHNVFISHASKIMLKIFQARLHWYMNQETPDV